MQPKKFPCACVTTWSFILPQPWHASLTKRKLWGWHLISITNLLRHNMQVTQQLDHLAVQNWRVTQICQVCVFGCWDGEMPWFHHCFPPSFCEGFYVIYVLKDGLSSWTSCSMIEKILKTQLVKIRIFFLFCSLQQS